MAKKKAVSAGNASEPTPEAFSPPIANECPTKANVRAKLQDILTDDGHTDYDAAIKQESLLAALLERYDPPLSTFCSGMVAGHLEAILDADPNIQLTARGRVYYGSTAWPASEVRAGYRRSTAVACPSQCEVNTMMKDFMRREGYTSPERAIRRRELRLKISDENDIPPECDEIVTGHINACIAEDKAFQHPKEGGKPRIAWVYLNE